MVLTVSCIFIFILAIIMLAGIYLYNLALNPNSSKSIVFKKRTEEERKKQEEEKEEAIKWLKQNSKDVYIQAKDNASLHAYIMENKEPSTIWAIVIHGYTGSADEMVDAIKQYMEMGYNVLAVNLRGHGKSQGDYIGMGWPDRLDILQWIDYIIQQDINSKIILYGISMGAATTMMVTGENLPNNVKLAIEDCGYTSAWDEFKNRLHATFHLPAFPILHIASLITKIKAGYGLKEASALEQVKKSKTPTLFIHGDKDKFVPFWMLDKLYDAANCSKEKLVIEGAEHAKSSITNPELYWNTIKKFIKKYI